MKWSYEELVIVFLLYLKTAFGKMHKGNPDVIRISELIGRSSSSVAMRLGNFASLDIELQKRGIKGLVNGRNVCKPIWEEFNESNEDFIYKAEIILAKFEKYSLNEKYNFILNDDIDYIGEDKIRNLKTRVNQSVFRKIILTDYSNKCAITGIDISDFLVASHIIPWSQNKDTRLNPTNGICLSTLYDRAFDIGYFGINDEYRIVTSSMLKKNVESSYYKKYFSFLDGFKIMLPTKYWPDKNFLEYHMNVIFQK